MPLTREEEQELAAIEGELQTRQAPQSNSGLTQEEEFELAQIEQELTERQSQEVSVNPTQEASLGFINRARYAIEPLESNRKALLVQEFGADNVQQDQKGNVFVRGQGQSQFRPVNKEGFSTADVIDFAGATPEMVGGLVGGVAGGLGASIPGAIAVGAAGGAAGSVARQGLSAILGTPQVATLRERVSETGLSGGIGGLFGGAGKGVQMAMPSIKAGAKTVGGAFKRTAEKVPGVQTVGEVFESTSKATKGVIDSLNKQFSFKKAVDAEEMLKQADEMGIDRAILPEAIEYGKESMISRSARTVAEGPLGEERLLNFNKAHMQVANAIDKDIAKLTPTGSVMSRDEAGQFLIDSVEQAKGDFFSGLDETFNNMVKGVPGLKIAPESQKKISTKLLGLERFAKGQLQSRGIGSQKQEAKSILEAVQSIRNSNGSFKQTVEAMQNLGKEAFKKGGSNRLPVDKERLQKLYWEIQEEVVETVRKTYGDDAAENLLSNNKMIKDFLGENAVLSRVIGKDGIAAENVYKSLIENSDTRKIEALQAILGSNTDKSQAIKATLMDSIIKRNNDGFVMFDSTINNFNKKKEVLSKLFTPEEMEGFVKKLQFGRRMGNPIMSTSGTGASNSFNDFMNRAKSAVVNESTIDLAKKRSNKNAAKFVKNTAPKSTRRRYIPSGPGKNGAYGNLLFDSGQRKGAYFTRGPSGEDSREDRK